LRKAAHILLVNTITIDFVVLVAISQNDPGAQAMIANMELGQLLYRKIHHAALSSISLSWLYPD
jgi:hypothetical protein